MKVFFDTEFTGLHQKTSLISIGLISEDEQTFYAEFTDYKAIQCDEWIINNVLKNLKYKPDEDRGLYDISGKDTTTYGHTRFVVERLEKWLNQFESIELWSDCLAYDFVLFNELWGHAFNIPKNIYYIPFDICTLFKIKNIDPDISREVFTGMVDGSQKHNALWDAKVIRACYDKLIKIGG